MSKSTKTPDIKFLMDRELFVWMSRGEGGGGGGGGGPCQEKKQLNRLSRKKIIKAEHRNKTSFTGPKMGKKRKIRA